MQDMHYLKFDYLSQQFYTLVLDHHDPIQSSHNLQPISLDFKNMKIKFM